MRILLLLVAVSAWAQSDTHRTMSQPFPAHKVIGNIYYVGSNALASFLITTPQGHILINSSFEETVPVIRASVEKLGYQFGDIKILLDSHAHGDHVDGHALVKKLTGATVMVMAGDDTVVAAKCPVDRVLHDGDEVKLGGSKLVAHLTPGHTKGDTTFTMTASEGGKTYNVVILGSVSVNPGTRLVNNADYPQIADDYRHSFRVLKSLACDVYLAPHGAQYGLDEKYPKLGKGPNPFIDPQGYRQYIDHMEQEFLTKLKEQQK